MRRPTSVIGGKAEEVQTCQYVLVRAFLVRRRAPIWTGMGPLETTQAHI